MELYEAIEKRRTTRVFLAKDVEFETIKRILNAGNKAPTQNHNRNWSYIILKDNEKKARVFDYANNLAEKFDAEKYLNIPRPYPVTPGQKMYAHALPLQFSMLEQAPYVIIPVFKSAQLKGDGVSHLNPLSTAWCVIENIFLAATAEGLSCSMRIPLDDEHEIVKEKLKVPRTYIMPAFIGIGYANCEEALPEQTYPNIEKQLHFESWK